MRYRVLPHSDDPRLFQVDFEVTFAADLERVSIEVGPDSNGRVVTGSSLLALDTAVAGTPYVISVDIHFPLEIGGLDFKCSGMGAERFGINRGSVTLASW